MKKIISIFLVVISLAGNISLAKAEDSSAQKIKLQRTEAQIQRLISQFHRDGSRLSDLKIRLNQIQNSLQTLDNPPVKPHRKLRPVKIDTQPVSQTSTPSSTTQTTLETGKASYYGPKLNGHHTASGDTFNDSLFTAAHRTLPFGTKVKVTNIANGNSVNVVINDRGPHVDGRVIDLTSAAFSALDHLSRGVIDVQLEVIDLAK